MQDYDHGLTSSHLTKLEELFQSKDSRDLNASYRAALAYLQKNLSKFTPEVREALRQLCSEAWPGCQIPDVRSLSVSGGVISFTQLNKQRSQYISTKTLLTAAAVVAVVIVTVYLMNKLANARPEWMVSKAVRSHIVGDNFRERRIRPLINWWNPGKFLPGTKSWAYSSYLQCKRFIEGIRNHFPQLKDAAVLLSAERLSPSPPTEGEALAAEAKSPGESRPAISDVPGMEAVLNEAVTASKALHVACDAMIAYSSNKVEGSWPTSRPSGTDNGRSLWEAPEAKYKAAVAAYKKFKDKVNDMSGETRLKLSQARISEDSEVVRTLMAEISPYPPEEVETVTRLASGEV